MLQKQVCRLKKKELSNYMEMFLFKLYCYLPRSRVTSPIKNMLSRIACPYNAEEHFWHDGCPACEGYMGIFWEAQLPKGHKYDN